MKLSSARLISILTATFMAFAPVNAGAQTDTNSERPPIYRPPTTLMQQLKDHDLEVYTSGKRTGHMDGQGIHEAAAATKSRVFNLKTAVDECLANNPTLKQYRETINQAVYATDLIRSNLFPNLSANFNGGSAQASTLATSSALFGGSTYNTYSGYLQLTQPLFVYGSLAAVRGDVDQQILNKLNVELQERALTQQVIQAFFNVILYKRILTFTEEMMPVVQKSLAVTEYRYKIGRAQLLDVLQAKTQLANLQPQIEQARNSFDAAGVTLATLMGLEGTTQIAVRGRLRNLFFKDIQQSIDAKRFYLPELEQNKLQIGQLKEARDTEMGKYWPSVTFTGKYGPTAYTQADFWNPNAVSWSALIGVSFPLFEGFASHYDDQGYASQEIQLNHARKQLEETIYSNQTTSKTSLDTSETSLVGAVEADKLAQESLLEAVRQYKLATIDFLQFLTIEQTALQTKSQVETLRNASIVAYTNYFVAMGQPLSVLIDILN